MWVKNGLSSEGGEGDSEEKEIDEDLEKYFSKMFEQ